MSFLAPHFFFGLFALSIPIIIHLFNFRRAKKVYFSSNRFLKKVSQDTRTKKQLKHLLILFSRLLFVLFLVLAFTQPFIPSDNSGHAGKVQLYLDNSLSMSNEVEVDITALDRGVGYVGQIVEQYPEGTQFRLLTNDFAPFSNIYRSGDEILDLTTELDYSRVRRSTDDISQRLFTAEEKNRDEDIYWISDFQASAGGGKPLIDTVNYYRILPLSFLSNQNVYIDSVFVENPLLFNNDNIKLFVRVSNAGEEEVQDLIVKIFINDLQATTASIAIPPMSNEVVAFDLAFNLERVNRCVVSFEDFPVTFDNEFFFTLKARRKVKILEIKEQPAITSVQKVYANTALFDFTSNMVGQLNYNLVREADLVVLNGISHIDNALFATLKNYSLSAGLIMIIPAPDIQPGSFSQLTGLDLKVKDTVAQTDLAAPDYKNPFFDQVFEEETTRMSMPAAKQTLSWFRDRSAILKYGNGDPYLSEIKNNGHFLIFASPLSLDYTGFSQHALFVPVMYKSAIRSVRAENSLYYYLEDGMVSLKPDSIAENSLVKLRAGESEIIPEQQIYGREVTLQLPGIEMLPGFYNLTLNDEMLDVLAFNHNSEESKLDQLKMEEIREIFANTKYDILNAGDPQNTENMLKEVFSGVHLWKYAIIFALVFLLVEILLFRFMS